MTSNLLRGQNKEVPTNKKKLDYKVRRRIDVVQRLNKLYLKLAIFFFTCVQGTLVGGPLLVVQDLVSVLYLRLLRRDIRFALGW